MNKRDDHLVRIGAACRSAGIRRTHQRMEIFAELAKATDHPTPEILYRRLLRRLPTVSLDTVYRTLATLARHNLVQKVETVQSQVRFEAVAIPHHHLICRECGEIRDFPWSFFDTTRLPMEANSWGTVERKSAVLTGICDKCRNKIGIKKKGRAG